MLRYEIREVNRIRVMRLSGQLSVTERTALRDILQKESFEADGLVVDMSQVFYIDSFGIYFLQNLLLKGSPKMKFAFVSNESYINYVLRFNKLDKMFEFEFVDTVENAVNRLQN